MLFTWTKSHFWRLKHQCCFRPGDCPHFLLFDVAKAWCAAGMFCYGDFCADVNKACCVSSPASVSWGGFWLCNFLQSKAIWSPQIAKIKSLLFEKKIFMTFPYSDPFSIHGACYCLWPWLRCVVCYQVTQNPPQPPLKTQVFATPNLEKDPFFPPKKQWSNQWNKQWRYLEVISVSLAFFRKIHENQLYLPRKIHSNFFSCQKKMIKMVLSILCFPSIQLNH